MEGPDMRVLIVLGVFAGLCGVFWLIERIHDRWAWRQAVREADALMRDMRRRCKEKQP